MSQLIPYPGTRQESHDGLELTAITRLKHTDLRKACRQFKNNEEFAAHLGIPLPTLYRWLSLRGAPPAQPTPVYPQKRLDGLERKLFKLTGKLLDELFPEALRRAIAAGIGKAREQTAAVADVALLDYAAGVRERLSYGNAEAVAQHAETGELRDRIRAVLHTLSFREREVIKMRYGLDGSAPMTLEEVGHVLKVTKSRVLQIEAKALRRLQQPSRASRLVGFDGVTGQITTACRPEDPTPLKERYARAEKAGPDGS